MKITRKFRSLLEEKDIIVAPGAYDALSAKIIERVGFPAVYLGSYIMQATVLGMPDTMNETLTEMVTYCRYIANAINIPVIADAENGFGNAIKVRRTVRELENAGVAAIHIEDHEFGKHTKLKPVLLPKEIMVEKIKAVVDTRLDKDFVIIARTDALWAYGDLKEAIERCKAYADAGADLLFIPTLPSQKVPEVAKILPVPLMNLNTPGVSIEEEKKRGLKILVYWSAPLLAAYKAVLKLMLELKNRGFIDASEDKIATETEFEQFIGFKEYETLAAKYKLIL